jgi:hypothetical protein
VPVNVIIWLALPLPVTNVNPVVWKRLAVPLETLSVSCIAAGPASTSAMEMTLPFAVENTSGVSSLTVCTPGTELIDASLIEATVIARLIGELVKKPSFAVNKPRS